jgi:methylenetetrahydrofolate--tRNA-(uracil-5-)-methyltransferase
MRPVRSTPAHQTGEFAELVCSNSLKSDSENTAPWLLKEEMRRAGSLLMEIARECAVPAGHALAVDRVAFASRVTEAIGREPLIKVRREEVTHVWDDGVTITASGPLTSDALSGEIARLSASAAKAAHLDGTDTAALKRCATQKREEEVGAGREMEGAGGASLQEVGCDHTLQGVGGDLERRGSESKLRRASEGATEEIDNRWHGQEARHKDEGARATQENLYFYDSISPIVEADSIDKDKVYMAARYDKGSADYINCPMTKEEYDRFLDALLEAQSVEERDWEKLNYFEACLPIEEIARRGRDTLRFGPMKPVGLRDPRTGRPPYAVVQLRQENLRADSYNLVGFQNHLKFGEQARVLRMIPGLENARFLRYGQIHRNTYINGPKLLTETLQMKAHPQVLFAGQICGVEGYVESIATGLLAGVNAAVIAQGGRPEPPPRASAFGSLVNYVARAEGKSFQPANITFDLLPALPQRVRDRKERHRRQCELALREFDAWWERMACPVG